MRRALKLPDDFFDEGETILARMKRARALSVACDMPAVFSNTIEFTLPSTANLREHPLAKAKRTKSQRMAGHVAALGFPKILPGEEWVFILTRCAPKRLDSDNVAMACKAIRDGIADRVKVNDGDVRILWEYEQRKSKTPFLKFEAWKINP